MAATLSNFFKAIGSQLSANAPAPESFSCSISHQHLLPPCLRGVQQAAELVVNWGYLMPASPHRRKTAKPHLSAEQRWVRHRGLRPSEMLTSDGAIRADFPALPPIHLADFSTWLRELYHLAVRQTLNHGRYFIERLRRLSLYLSQALGCL